MLDLLMLAAALLGVSFIVLSCCSPPTSSKVSFNQTSNNNDGMATGIEGETYRPRKLGTIDCENVYKEKTLEDEEKKRERKRKGRERVSKSSAAPPSRPAKKKSTQFEGGKEKPMKKRKSPVDNDDKVKKGGKKEGRKRESTADENDKNSIGRTANTAIDSDRPVDSRGRPVKDDQKKKKKKKDEQRDKDNDDESNKGEGGGGSKISLDDSHKTSGTPKLQLAPTQLPSTERVGTAETMASRDKMDEVESGKQKRDGSPRTPVLSPPAIPPSAEPTQVDSEKPKKGSNETTPPPPLPAKSPKKMPPPKKKVNKKKEEEVRQWNEAIARGNVFRPRKDDETIDEVNVDWNG